MDTDTGCASRGDRVFSTVHRLEFDVPWPPKHVAAYVIDGPEPILIDAGTPGDDGEPALERGLERAGYTISDIEHVLVTHPHSDHLGQADTLRGAGATIYAPAKALDRLRTDPETIREGVHETGRGAGYDGDRLAEIVDGELESFRRNRRLLDPDATVPIDPGATIAVGDRQFRALETPGHQIHHLSFETDLEGTTVLFSGDALVEPFRPGAFQVGVNRGAYGGVDAYYDAMDRLETTAATHVCPGHGPTFDDPRRAVTLTRNRLDDLLVETRAAVDAVEPATPLAVAEERIGSVRYTAPVMDTMGALGTLERRGEVEYELEGGVRYYRR